ncbi:ATP-binding cassette domain-containing protein [Knoellia sp. CPCC 206450]|uniref:ATP-binding cassette domain-containing protein n=1 Tax=Knoellia tibetensis TaxID=3404798 RepID=UPI003B428EA0
MTGSGTGEPIRFEGVSKAYGSHRVLEGFDVSIRAGAVTALLGPNGSGKTTALRILLGHERADAGRALVGGVAYQSLRFPLRHVGALLDASWVHPRRSARAQLTWLAQASGLPRSAVEPALAQVGLHDVADNAVGTFSLGMRQRLGIAGTILGDPSVLVFDEPLNGLDQSGVVWVRQFLADQAAHGRTVLLSTHLLHEVELSAHDVVVIGRRAVLYAGPTSGLSTDWERSVRVDLVDHDPHVRDLEAIADRRGWRLHARTPEPGVRSFTIQGADVDDVAAELSSHRVPVRRVEAAGSLADAYVSLTEGRADHVGAGPA